MDQRTWPNLVAMYFETAARKADHPFLWARVGDAYQPLSWRASADRVSALAAGLRELGVQKGDRIIVVSENRPEWLIADVAIMAIGAITVPAYVTNTEADHLHIATNSGARGAIVSTRRLAERFLPAAHKSDDMRFVVAMEPPDIDQNLSVSLHAWDEVIASGGTGQAEAEAASWGRDDTACIIYTSGTGGAPKGVMLHHGAILHNCRGAYDALLELGLGDEVFLSFLPLSHSYEHTAGQFFPLSIGAQIYYAEGIDTLAKNMVEVRPTFMTAVPRLYETLHARLVRGINAKGGLSKRLFENAVKLGRKRYEARERLSVGEHVADAILERLVRDKVRRRFGGRLKALVSGGAPLNPDIGLFFTALGLNILQGYGQTEAAPVISVNRPNRVKIHTVGPAVIDTDVRIADDGEILVRGELVMQGYWRNSEATAEVIRDGWLHTGDVGRVDEDGYIEITDRKKDIIVNSGGDNVSPQRIEGILTLAPEIAQAMVFGDSRPHLVALLVPDEEWSSAWAIEHGKGPELAALSEDHELHAALAAIVDSVNGQLSMIEKVRHFLIARAPFTIDNEQLTPTLKVRRHKIVEIYGDALDALYH
ncbi:MAG: long-chain fatty acid--CoA ligase [Rhodospirillales bacterium]|nr:long-chain fatty acid--CoA ligase [Rhodospirillales bacterium]